MKTKLLQKENAPQAPKFPPQPVRSEALSAVPNFGLLLDFI
jgi:hypothetical protein